MRPVTFNASLAGAIFSAGEVPKTLDLIKVGEMKHPLHGLFTIASTVDEPIRICVLQQNSKRMIGVDVKVLVEKMAEELAKQ